MKYTFSRTLPVTVDFMPDGEPLVVTETFTAVEAFSFDEAIAAVEKGIRDRKLQLQQRIAELKAKEEILPKKDEAPKVNVPNVNGVPIELSDAPPVPMPTRDNRPKNINK